MTNEQILRSLPLKDFASLIIRREYVEHWVQVTENTNFFGGHKIVFITSDGLEFEKNDYRSALEHECWWLQQEAVACCEKQQMEGENVC